MLLELLELCVRHLDSGKYPPVIGTVVAVMKQADVPPVSYGGQERVQSARALGKLETV